MFSFTVNDWFDDCTCAKCRAVNEEEGTRAGTYARALAAVGEIVGREFPDKYIYGSAYQWTRRAPKECGPFPKNVLFNFSPIECDWSRPLDRSAYSANIEAVRDIRGWARCARGGLSIWDYNTSYADRPLVFPNVTARQGTLKWYREMGVWRISAEGAHKGNGASFAELKAWLDAKLMWNPDRDLSALLDQFFRGFYGPAAPFARKYFDAVESLPRNEAEHPLLCMEESVYTTLQDDAFLQAALGWWNQAVEATEGQSKKYRRAAELGKFSVVYAILRKAVPMLLPTENHREIERYRPLAKWAVNFVDREPRPIVVGMFHFAKDDPQFATWRLLAEKGAAAACRTVYEESNFWFVLKDMVQTHPDATASGGKAARIGPTFWAWCLHRSLTHDVYVDKGQTYRIRAHARLDLKPGAKATDMAMSGGVYAYKGGRTFRKDLTVGEMSERYAWYDLGEWNPAQCPDAKIWFALGEFDKERNTEHASVAAVWIDQFALEPVRKSPAASDVTANPIEIR